MSETRAELAGWLRLTRTPGVGNQTRRLLLKTFGLPDAIFSAGRSALAGAVGERLAESLLASDVAAADIDTALAWAAQAGNRILSLAADGASLRWNLAIKATSCRSRGERLSRSAWRIRSML